MATASSESSSRTPSATVSRRQLFEDLLADGVVDLGQRREVEVRAHQLDQARAQFRIERLEDRAGVRLMQFADKLAQRAGVACVERLDDASTYSARKFPSSSRGATAGSVTAMSFSSSMPGLQIDDRWEGLSCLYAGASPRQFIMNCRMK